jgi:hypothetical protein
MLRFLLFGRAQMFAARRQSIQGWLERRLLALSSVLIAPITAAEPARMIHSE